MGPDAPHSRLPGLVQQSFPTHRRAESWERKIGSSVVACNGTEWIRYLISEYAVNTKPRREGQSTYNIGWRWEVGEKQQDDAGWKRTRTWEARQRDNIGCRNCMRTRRWEVQSLLELCSSCVRPIHQFPQITNIAEHGKQHYPLSLLQFLFL